MWNRLYFVWLTLKVSELSNIVELQFLAALMAVNVRWQDFHIQFKQFQPVLEYPFSKKQQKQDLQSKCASIQYYRGYKSIELFDKLADKWLLHNPDSLTHGSIIK